MIDSELIAEIRDNPKIIKYLDIPLQHASDAVLKRMNRKGSGQGYLQLINQIKSQIPDIAIRTTFIAGFPGESEEDVDTLCEFLQNAQFFSAGFFAYSKEPHTPAFKLDGHMKQSVKNARVKRLYKVQKQISKRLLANFKGKTLKITCDGIDYEKQCFFGRAYFQAPDIDGKVYFTANPEVVVNQGETYEVKITRTGAYDLYGRII